jgi:hypothetical protein
MPGETHFFDDIYARSQEVGDLKDLESVKWVIGRLRMIYGRYNEKSDQKRIYKPLQKRGVIEGLLSCRTYQEVFSWFMEIQMRFMGKVRWRQNMAKDIF